MHGRASFLWIETQRRAVPGPRFTVKIVHGSRLGQRQSTMGFPGPYVREQIASTLRPVGTHSLVSGPPSRFAHAAPLRAERLYSGHAKAVK